MTFELEEKSEKCQMVTLNIVNNRKGEGLMSDSLQKVIDFEKYEFSEKKG